jgi:hypothetical protein
MSDSPELPASQEQQRVPQISVDVPDLLAAGGALAFVGGSTVWLGWGATVALLGLVAIGAAYWMAKR